MNVKKSNTEDTVLDHLIKIVDYLVSNIDEKTNCLKILYGDWNDAINGLGRTKSDKMFGTGVSVMASLQLYQVLYQIYDILYHIQEYTEKTHNYLRIRETLAKGLEKYAIEKDRECAHIIHGWGDELSYKVGSTKDSDGKCRYSATANSFWCISDMLERDVSIKNSILNAYDNLDSKYGITTIHPYIPPEMECEVGRIADLTPGTLENSCAYLHSTTFAIISLFKMGECKRAWEQIEKIVPLTHQNLTLSSFIMSNSYFYNEEYQMDGESMVDWYTGSGSVLLRGIIENAIGIQPNLDGLKICLPQYVPSNALEVDFKIKGDNVNLVYKNKFGVKRRYLVNNKEYEVQYSELNVPYIFIPNDKITNQMKIEITD